jgi:hypothetical protein
MEDTRKTTPETQVEQQELSRRQLLKIMSATGGVLATSAFLPNKWLSPMVEIGLLPAHAQATGDLTISDLQYTSGVTMTGPKGARDFIQGSPYTGNLKFSDPSAGLNNSTCQVNMTQQGSSSSIYVPTNSAAVLYQSSYGGTVTWPFYMLTNATSDVCTELENTATSQKSNQLCKDLPNSI